MITNDPSHFSPIELTTRVQDHATVDCNYLFKTGAGATRKFFDFRKTYEHRSDILNNHFNNINWKTLFVGQKIDNLPVIFTDTIQEGWEQHGIYKCVNSSSRPWFTPLVKTCTRDPILGASGQALCFHFL